MSFPRYESYKDSGVEWLGEVPEHWDVIRLRFLCQIKTGDADTADAIEEGEYPFFVRSQVIERIGRYTHDCEAVLTAGDGVGVGKVFHYFQGKFCAHQRVYIFCNFRRICGKFFYQYIKDLFLRVVLEGTAKSTVDSLRRPMIADFWITVPPAIEQTTIAAFLDRETAKIDALIAEQQRLIALLKEKRQAVISHAVTKGLNPDAPMKDSGVEWLGEVPEHWEVKRLRFVSQLNPSKGETAKLDRETEVSFLPMEAIGEDGSLNLERTRPIGEVETGYTYFREGDVTTAKITPCFENGKGAIMRGLLGGIGFGTTELIVARPLPSETTSNYLHWIFISSPFRKRGEASMYGAGGQKRVPDDFVRNFAIAFPAVTEQTTIAAFLDRETAKLDALTAEAKTAITLLQERRTALISAAVTGKIDVRGFASDSTN